MEASGGASTASSSGSSFPATLDMASVVSSLQALVEEAFHSFVSSQTQHLSVDDLH